MNSTAALISGLVASGSTRNTHWLCLSATKVLFSEIDRREQHLHQALLLLAWRSGACAHANISSILATAPCA